MIDFNNRTYSGLKPSDAEKHRESIKPLLVEGEHILGVYKVMSPGRDFVVFTDKRIIAADLQGVTGKKTDYTSLPYSKMSAFSVETAGHFDLDCELNVCIAGAGVVKFEFLGDNNVIAIGQAIAKFIL